MDLGFDFTEGLDYMVKFVDVGTVGMVEGCYVIAGMVCTSLEVAAGLGDQLDDFLCCCIPFFDVGGSGVF